jgi:[ribosomal protein S5]-alanine N-acetyltransferase
VGSSASGFLKTELASSVAACDARSHPSYPVMEKLGMRREALFKKDVLRKGQRRDSYLYAALTEGWDSASRA